MREWQIRSVLSGYFVEPEIRHPSHLSLLELYSAAAATCRMYARGCPWVDAAVHPGAFEVQTAVVLLLLCGLKSSMATVRFSQATKRGLQYVYMYHACLLLSSFA